MHVLVYVNIRYIDSLFLLIKLKYQSKKTDNFLYINASFSQKPDIWRIFNWVKFRFQLQKMFQKRATVLYPEINDISFVCLIKKIVIKLEEYVSGFFMG